MIQLNREQTENQRTFDLPDEIDFKPEVQNEPEVNVIEPEVSLNRPGDELKAVLDPKRVSTTSQESTIFYFVRGPSRSAFSKISLVRVRSGPREPTVRGSLQPVLFMNRFLIVIWRILIYIL